MEIVAFTPSRLNSQRVPQKNIKLLGGIPLVNYALQTMTKTGLFEDIFIFASEPSVCDYIKENAKYSYLKRPASLDTQETKVQDLISEFLKLCDADIIAMFHITSPFLRTVTIQDCLQKVISGSYDSALTAFRIDRRCWFKGKRLNFSEADTLEHYDEAVIVEHSLYIFRRKLFETTGQRISSNPYIRIIDPFEGHDIDTPEDFRIAELLVSAGLFEFNQ